MLGLPIAALIHPANIHESKGTTLVIKQLVSKSPCLKKFFTNGGYRGSFEEFVERLGWNFEAVLYPQESVRKFVLLPLRWIVERTFPWMENYRRMTVDYERSSNSAEAMLYVSFCQSSYKLRQ